MNRIALLPEDVASKIAAGEVIERPFSVVKELVENALDAQATEVKVELIDGGNRQIRVTDNGIGMSREDAQIAFERHSTSKISTEADLDRIKTLGFRGEALPSISAVSFLVLKTAEEGEPEGTQIERRGEEVIRVSDTAFPRGTSVEVKDLFFNLPARRKFLKSDRSELSQIVKYMTQVALAAPQTRFSLFQGQRKVFDYPAVSGLKERLFQVYGGSVVDGLLEVNHREEEMALFGFASRPPAGGRRDRRQQLFFVNGRPVKDSTLQAALNSSYRGFLEKDHFASAFLFLGVPLADVDVNVHPTKTEIRFRDANTVFRFVFRSLEKALLKEMGVKDLSPARPETDWGSQEGTSQKYPGFPRLEKQVSEERILFPSSQKEEDRHPVLGQFDNTYILAAEEDGLLIIDQHNAHERVLYERYAEIDSQHKWPQKLALMPVVFDLSPSQSLSLEDNRHLLEEAGFRFESMGGQSYALKEYPGIFLEEEAKDIFLSLVEEIKEEAVEDKKKKILATLACKTAVKAGELLPRAKMEYLVKELFKTPHYSFCPHGRPILIKIQKGEIEKGLKRPKN